MKVAIAQQNPVVGDIVGNTAKIGEVLEQCRGESPDLVVFPELFLTGYPPRDLLERHWFIGRVNRAVGDILKLSHRYPETGILLGSPRETHRDTGRGLYNAALLIQNGDLLFSQPKSLLPAYDVFDEERYFDPAPSLNVIRFHGHVLGISVCEDAWNDPHLWPRRFYPFDPQSALARMGATLFINISASPFSVGKENVRFEIFRNHAKKHSIPLCYVNQVGGNDELIFDGRSMCFNENGDPVAVLHPFEEQTLIVDIDHPPAPVSYRQLPEIESLYMALVLGLRDYMRKCGFSRAIVGLSGGIDSAVVCCLAHAAVGAENVLGVTMPGPYSSPGSVGDSKALARNLGIRLLEIPITPVYRSYESMLSGLLTPGEEVGVTFENIQARIRGNVVMALSNEFGHLVLSTGNKSELAVGYCTLYGDMSGGLAVISDVPKTMVYRLAEYISRKTGAIPDAILIKAPSAELRPDQQDEDTLPPYPVLDRILAAYVDEGQSPEEITGHGIDPKMVEWVVGKVDSNEYKRRQAAPGLKVTPKAFGSGRRMPVAARYHTF
ncbi:MAG: NAD+ synthase [Methanomicrobiaceae archaeon]|nr:NAD+ synthase [Methanomicrobiaceae archaeon]